VGGIVDRIVDRALGLAPRVPRVEVDRDLAVPMPDGVVLLADRYRPAGDAPLPVVVVRCPYGRRGFWGTVFGAAYARQGLQVVVQSVRGTFGSGGEFQALRQEKDDGLATAAWIRAQPWCDGRLAGAGLSYLGFTQWAVAPYLDPPFAAVCLGVTASEFNSQHYPGGSFSLYGALSWTALTGRQERVSSLRALLDPVQERRTVRAMAHLPLRDADTAAIGRRWRFWRDVVGHAEPGDDFWAAADHSPAVPDMAAPATMLTGWYDLFLPWQLRDFTTLRAAGRTARITVGPWAHSDPAALRAQVRDQVDWLRAHLLDGPPPAGPAVRAYLQHADTWLDFPRWPPAGTTPTALYLHPDGALGWQPPPGGAQAEPVFGGAEHPQRLAGGARAEPVFGGAEHPQRLPGGGPDGFTYDPADPTPSTGGPLISGRNRQRDNRAVEARPDVLCYTGEPLDRDLDLMGEVRARVYVRTEVAHADVFVRLCDVDTRGVSRNVSDGILRLRPGAPAAAPDGTVAADVEMWPTGYRLRRGHRIRVQVSGGAFPRFPRNHGTGEPIADAVAMRTCRHEVCHDPARPSHLVLPVLPGEA
jgi:predicted acyl esterase